jgi:hypothetical protein
MEISDEGSEANIAFWKTEFGKFVYAETETEAGFSVGQCTEVRKGHAGHTSAHTCGHVRDRRRSRYNRAFLEN